MKFQTKQQKEAEREVRRRYLKERIKKLDISHCVDYDSFECGILERFIESEMWGNVKEKKILELGSESGNLSLHVLTKFEPKIIVTSDLSDSLIEAVLCLASKMNFKKIPKICIVDNVLLPFQNDSFDMVFSCNTLHHLPDPSICVKEVGRVLRENGFFLMMIEPFFPNHLPFLKYFFSRQEKKEGLCETIFPLKQWKGFMHNFELLKIEFYSPLRLRNIIPNVENLFKYLTGGWLTILAKHK